MKYIEIDDELYKFLASQTERIGESASDILRRLIHLPITSVIEKEPQQISEPSLETKVSHTSTPVKKKATPKKGAIKHTFSVTPLDSLLSDTSIQKQKGAVGRFLYILERLENMQGAAFQNVLNIQGRGRLYFATSKQELLKASKTSNPKEIGTTGYWVITNSNTAKKRTILNHVLCQSGIPEEKAKLLSQLI
tara:strand:+ start:1793 stop:2371 length:579 start_codon:yes stop_codon:yes gene_type:complete